jgi:hypothetical protein
MELTIRIVAMMIVILIAVLIAAGLILQWGGQSGSLLDQILKFFNGLLGAGSNITPKTP